MRGWCLLEGGFRSSPSPSYLRPRQDRWHVLHEGCSKIKIQIFLARERVGQKKPEEVHASGELFYSFSGITSAGNRVYLTRRESSSHTGLKSWEAPFYSWEFVSWRNLAFIQGGVFSYFCPESEPICLATRNNQSRFSAIPSACGESAIEDGVNARLHGCTEWLAVAMSRALPAHPHVHNVTD